MKIPAHAIRVNGRDISNLTHSRLIRLTLIDNSGMAADQLTLTLDDSDGKLEIPPRKARLTLALGWKGEPLIDKGEFIVDEITHEGPPDQLTLVNRSANFTSTFTTKKNRSWHETTLGEILNRIADDHSLKAAINDTLAAKPIPHIDQTDETDSHFLTRLAKRYGAIVCVKSGHLLFKPRADKTSVSGQPLPAITLHRKQGDKHRYSANSRENYNGVRAFWYDTDNSQRVAVVVGDSSGKIKNLVEALPTEQEAVTAAETAWAQLQRQGVSLSLHLAEPQPALAPETPINLQGFKKKAINQQWILKTVTHEFGDSGYRQRLELTADSP